MTAILRLRMQDEEVEMNEEKHQEKAKDFDPTWSDLDSISPGRSQQNS